MRSPGFIFTAAIVLLMCHLVLCEDEEEENDDDIKGPLIGLKSDGSMYTTAEIIERNKYKPEKHEVTTKDGYKLTVFRVTPKQSTAVPVLLQHGFVASSDGWVSDPDALPFKLSDAGYDVWLNNVRGNFYSRNHTTLKLDDVRFWNFSWHEMGTQDIPAVIDYILQTTNQSALHYVGHSMGTTMSYVMLSTRPEYNAKIKSLISLAPVAILSKVAQLIGPDGMVEEMAAKFMSGFKDSGKLEVFPRKDVANNNKTQITCSDMKEDFSDICEGKMEEFQSVVGGPYLPAGSSFKALEHFYQMRINGEMKYYNLSTPGANKEAYGSEEPPSYLDKFNAITAPTFLWSTQADQAVLPEDVDKLMTKLPKGVKDNRIKDEECFDHIAFICPRQKSCLPLRAKLYKDMISAMKSVDDK